MDNKITLFVMQDCHLCPQMVKLFEGMIKNGAIDALEILDVAQHETLARHLNIRSLPFYQINGVAFSGVRSTSDIQQLLDMDGLNKWQQQLRQLLQQGEITVAEESVKEHVESRNAVVSLLTHEDSDLMLRIGLTAVIESVAKTGIFDDFEQQFIILSNSPDESIAIDAIYYLSLIATPHSINRLIEVTLSNNSSQALKDQALELLEELNESKN